MSLNYIALGKRIREQRKKLKMSQNTLAELIDCEPTFVSYIENGKRGMSLETLINVANALETTADELLKDSLRCFHIVADHAAGSCLEDCSFYESKILLDIMEMTKNMLRENRKYIQKGRGNYTKKA